MQIPRKRAEKYPISILAARVSEIIAAILLSGILHRNFLYEISAASAFFSRIPELHVAQPRADAAVAVGIEGIIDEEIFHTDYESTTS